MTLKIAVIGAEGRMGRANIATVAAHPDAHLVAAIARAGSTALGKDAGTLAGREALGVAITSDLADALDVAEAVIDFTAPQTSLTLAQTCAERGLIHVIGTTGCSAEQDAAIAAAGASGARIVKSGNMSLGVNLLANLVRQAAKALDENFDIEIFEMHHRHKVDAPSGTALLLGEAAAQGRGITLAEHVERGRDGHTGARQDGAIGFAALRGGTVVGEHSAIFAGPRETITLSHGAQDRAIFANGAVKAALWARDRAPGLYSMADVLGLSDSS